MVCGGGGCNGREVFGWVNVGGDVTLAFVRLGPSIVKQGKCE